MAVQDVCCAGMRFSAILFRFAKPSGHSYFALLLARTQCAVLCRDFRFAFQTAVIRVRRVPVVVLRR